MAIERSAKGCAPDRRARRAAGSVWRSGACLRLAAVLLAAVLFAAVLFAPALAQAAARSPQRLELDLHYQAHRACPSGSAFLEVLQQHLAAGGEGPVEGDVNIVRRSASGDFELRLRLRVRGRDYASVAHAHSCETLMRLAALSAAIARTGTLDEAAAAADESPADPDDFPDATPELIPNSPPPRALPEFDAALAARAELAPDSPPTDARPTTTERGWRAAERRWFALAALRTTNAMLPERAWGPGAAVGLAHAPWSLRLTGIWWQPQRALLSREGVSPIELSFEQQSLELSPCWGNDVSSFLRIEGCASLAAHRIHTSAPETHITGTFGAGALVSLRLWRDLHLEFGGGLQFAIAAPDFLVRLERVYRPETIEPVAQLGLAWEFGAPEPRATTPELTPPSLDESTRRAAR